MGATSFITTARLLLKPLALSDASFIFELVNTEGWLTFIGNRNITSAADALAYIQKILENENTAYWVVEHADSHEKIGIVTFIKRDYLPHHDIGFALLPRFCKNGYAYEATSAVLNYLISHRNLSYIFAITIPENERSIKLLQRIGFRFEKDIDIAEKTVQVYGMSAGKLIN